MYMIRVVLAAIVVGAMAGLAGAQETKSEVTVPFFGNATCPISGEAVDQKLFVKVGDEKVFVCCKKCVAKVEADPKAALAKAYPADKLVDLKNEVCPVMGEKVKEGVAVDFQGHRVHFCCKKCVKKFLMEPNKNLAMLTHKGELKDLANDHCAVKPDEKVSADQFAIYKGQIVNFCCGDCIASFAKSPEKYLEAMKKTKKDAE